VSRAGRSCASSWVRSAPCVRRQLPPSPHRPLPSHGEVFVALWRGEQEFLAPSEVLSCARAQLTKSPRTQLPRVSLCLCVHADLWIAIVTDEQRVNISDRVCNLLINTMGWLFKRARLSCSIAVVVGLLHFKE
jgi:hypothetical protein